MAKENRSEAKSEDDSGVVMIAIDLIMPDPDNPNVEDVGTFNDVVRSIQQDGFIENLVVRPAEDGRFVLVSGEHRWKAGKMLDYKKVPCKVMNYTAEEAAVRLVRMNALKGKIDPERFTRLYNKLKKTMDPEEIKRQMGYGSRDNEFQKLIKQVAGDLPPAQRAEFAKRAEKIRTVEDLAAVVQSIFAQSGATVNANFIVFGFGGRTHLSVIATDVTIAPMLALAEQVHAAGLKLDEVLAEACAMFVDKKHSKGASNGATEDSGSGRDVSG